jgi:hypothetical protein
MILKHHIYQVTQHSHLPYSPQLPHHYQGGAMEDFYKIKTPESITQEELRYNIV